MTKPVFYTQPATVRALKRAEGLTRHIEGIASSGRKDKHGEILVPSGAKWTCPLPLLSDHMASLQIGEVVKIWLDGDVLRFRARVDSDDVWQRIVDGRKRKISVGLESFEAEMKDGTRHVTDWRIREISLVTNPANADATATWAEQSESRELKGATGSSSSEKPVKVRPAAAKPEAPTHVPPLVAEKQRVEGVLMLAKKRHSDFIDKINNLRPGDGDNYALYTAEIRQVRKDIESAQKRILNIDGGRVCPVTLQPKAAHEMTAPGALTPEVVTGNIPSEERTYTTKRKAAPRVAWKIPDVSEPEWPASFRDLTDAEAADAMMAVGEYHAASFQRIAEKEGAAPAAPVGRQYLEEMLGEAFGLVMTLHRRVRELEQNQTRFCGRHDRSRDYRKGDSVIYRNQLWQCIRSVEAGTDDNVPGQSPAWLLTVRQGECQ